MKATFKIFFLIVMLSAGCSKPGGHEDQNGMEEGKDEGPNQALYNEVMDIHNEVMPRMGEIERLKRELNEKIAKSPDMIVEKREQLTQLISALDSAGASMMDWMHNFNPPPDSVGEEDQREYLESEMERIKKVRDRMNESIEKAKAAEGN